MPFLNGALDTEPLREPRLRAGTWDAEARRVRLLAAELGGTVDAQALLYADVRDLMALRECLRSHLGQHAARFAWRTRRRPCCARAQALFGVRLPAGPR